MYTKEELIEEIIKIRNEIGHEYIEPTIKEIFYNNDELTIITPDRPEKSVIIGKGGWVVGKLREKLQIKSIHVVSYTDILLEEYQLKLSVNHVEKIIKSNRIPNDYNEPFNNLYKLLKAKQEEPYNKEIISDYIDNNINSEIYSNANCIVALSGGVDSSFSVLLTRSLGFNTYAMTVDPGTIILPKQFRRNIDKLSAKINVPHEYLKIDMKNIIDEALNGKIHPCGRCSNAIEEKILTKANSISIPLIIFGDLLSTGSQAITQKQEITRINLPALYRMEKQEIKNIIQKYDVNKIKGYGCPLLVEVHKNYPQYKNFSIQRVLRETRAGILEPGQALELIKTIY